MSNSIFKFLIFALFMILVLGCKKKEEDEPSFSSQITRLDLEYNNTIISTTISGTEIVLNRPIPVGAEELSVNVLKVSNGATADISDGDVLKVSQLDHYIKVTSENGESIRTYHLNLDYQSNFNSVESNGLLQVSGNKIVNKNGEAVSFAGNSFFWSNNGWGGERYYNKSVVSWLKQDWNSSIVRAAMGVEDPGGYLEDKVNNKARLKTVVDAAISEGMYVIIDWHSHHAEDNTAEAVTFFEEMATLYGSYDNIIYEIYNEPLDISWSSVIKPYAEKVISAIRAIDSDNIIVVGTPRWSQDVDQPAADPITISTNIAYTLHFYTVHHQQALRDKCDQALNSGIAIFATEWGSVGYTFTDPETDLWMNWCKENKISHCNWAVNEKVEEWSIVKQGASVEGNWQESDLTEAGKLSKEIILGWNE